MQLLPESTFESDHSLLLSVWSASLAQYGDRKTVYLFTFFICMYSSNLFAGSSLFTRVIKMAGGEYQ